MRGRRAWVLLLLAAVFTMHGLLGGDHDDQHGSGGHLGAWCLGVLAAALAAALVLLAPQLPPLRLRPRQPGRARRSPTLLRPPDLHSLCLLRI